MNKSNREIESTQVYPSCMSMMGDNGRNIDESLDFVVERLWSEWAKVACDGREEGKNKNVVQICALTSRAVRLRLMKLCGQ